MATPGLGWGLPLPPPSTLPLIPMPPLAPTLPPYLKRAPSGFSARSFLALTLLLHPPGRMKSAHEHQGDRSGVGDCDSSFSQSCYQPTLPLENFPEFNVAGSLTW